MACAGLFDDTFVRPYITTGCDALTYRLLKNVLMAGGTVLISPANSQAGAHLTLWGESCDCLSANLNVAIAEAASQVLLRAAKKFPQRFGVAPLIPAEEIAEVI